MAKRKHAHRASSPRASWKGLFRFGLVSFQVEAINAHAAEESDIHFHQLHATCHSRIHYQKVCPIHGEVSNDEIVSGYEYGRGKYVEIEPEELDRLRTNHEKALTIDAFVPPGEIDPIYYDGRMYYLVPAGPADREAYALLQAAMVHQERSGIGQVVFSGKDQLVLVRPRGDLLVMSMLNYAAEIRSPEDVEGTQRAAKPTPRKLKLAEDLVKASATRHVDLAHYEDRYRERVEELIKAKAGGKEIVAPAEDEEEPVINLMDALKRSLQERQGHAASHNHRGHTHSNGKSRTAHSQRRSRSSVHKGRKKAV